MSIYRKAAIALGAAAAVIVTAAATGFASASEDASTANTQIAELYQLQATFHRATTLQSPNDLEQRVADMLSLWTEDGSFTLGSSTFRRKGRAPERSSCAPGAGTLCDFFMNVAPPFHNEWIALAPVYMTRISTHGETANLEYECHYFAAGTWEPRARFTVSATARREQGLLAAGERSRDPAGDFLRPLSIDDALPPTTACQGLQDRPGRCSNSAEAASACTAVEASRSTNATSSCSIRQRVTQPFDPCHHRDNTRTTASSRTNQTAREDGYALPVNHVRGMRV